jgi:hypothetical protein
MHVHRLRIQRSSRPPEQPNRTTFQENERERGRERERLKRPFDYVDGCRKSI